MTAEKAADIVSFIAKSLVSQPDAVKVTIAEKESSVVLELSVAPDDMGRIIGKQGRIAKAIRTVVKSATSREKKRYSVDII